MKLTNRLKIPEAIVRAVKNDQYSKGDADYSVTGLLKPSRQVALEKEHYDELVEDASDRVWSLLGQAVHTILERAAAEDVTTVAERRLSIKCKDHNNKIVSVSGSMDTFIINSGTIQDYKITTSYKIKDGQAPEEWVQQLNIYAEILRSHNIPVRNLQVCAILRDWSKLESFRDPAYPRQQVVMVDVPMWSQEETRAFIKERVISHQRALDVLPECSNQEMWAKVDKWAVMPKAGVRALKLHETEESAVMHSSSLKGTTVEARPGERTRCKHYCSVAPFCKQYQEYKKKYDLE